MRTRLHPSVLESGLEESSWWEAAYRRARSCLRTGREGWDELIVYGGERRLGWMALLNQVGRVGAPPAALKEAKMGLHF